MGGLGPGRALSFLWANGALEYRFVIQTTNSGSLSAGQTGFAIRKGDGENEEFCVGGNVRSWGYGL